MVRRLWIIPKGKVTDKDIADAELNGCPEIVSSVPPRLEGIVSPSHLPFAYEEPEPVPPVPTRDLTAEVDTVKTDVADVKTKLADIDLIKTDLSKVKTAIADIKTRLGIV